MLVIVAPGNLLRITYFRFLSEDSGAAYEYQDGVHIEEWIKEDCWCVFSYHYYSFMRY